MQSALPTECQRQTTRVDRAVSRRRQAKRTDWIFTAQRNSRRSTAGNPARFILTENGYVIAEIDSVPGGIGLTGWLNQTYSTFDTEIVGGADGMLDGFRSVLPDGGDIVMSQESATYRPEMEWIAARLNQQFAVAPQSRDDSGSLRNSQPAGVNAPGYSWRVVPARELRAAKWPRRISLFRIIRFAEHPRIEKTLRANAEGRITITPPIKPIVLEEKMWFALFWMQPLRKFWRRELGDKYFINLQEVIPYSWLLDPTPLPQHAVIPRLEIHDWCEAAKFSQKDRDLLLKVSGFAPRLGKPRHRTREWPPARRMG